MGSITINLLRISPDSQYIEFSVACPTGYVFNKLYIERYDGVGDYAGWKDCSNLLQGTTTTEIMRITTSSFGGSSLFYVEFGVKWTSTTIAEPTDGCSPLLSTITSVGACSDVNLVYGNLLDSIMKMNLSCLNENDYMALTRNHLFLYAHMEAMRLGRYSEAEGFYDVLKNLFSNCGPDTRVAGVYNPPCGCSTWGAPAPAPTGYYPPAPLT